MRIYNKQLLSFFFLMISIAYSMNADNAIRQIDTKSHTILKVRTANDKNKQIIIASDYEGNLLGVDFTGRILWATKLASGTMNHDVWCADIDNDNRDEILAANANGHLYCLNINGDILWSFKPYQSNHLTPMYSVCVVKDQRHKPFIVCGDFSSNCYYLDANGKLVMTLPSSEYSRVTGWGNDKPDDYKSNANFLRPLPQTDGSDLLAIHSINNHMQSCGQLYLLQPLSSKVICSVNISKMRSPIGEMRVVDSDNDGHYDILLGTSTLNTNNFCNILFSKDYKDYKMHLYTLNHKEAGVVSYRVNQPFILKSKNDFQYVLLSSNQMVFYPSNGSRELVKHISTSYAFFDVWIGHEDKIILASVQDGGSCIYIIDTHKNGWEDDFHNLQPNGKIEKIKEQTTIVRTELALFKKPSWQRKALIVTGLESPSSAIASKVRGKSLVLLASPWNRGHCEIPTWRSPLYDGNRYERMRDRRDNYDWTAKRVYDFYIKSYDNSYGMSTWGGHGNDPLYYDLKVLKDIAYYGYSHGKKKTIYVYPEMNHVDTDFKFVMDNHIYPLTEYLRECKSNIAFRAKNIFWQGQVYTDNWSRVISGEFADVVVPLLEETSDKTQDLSIAGRMGLWAAGAVDGWGVRCSRDDPSFDRSRQFSSQKMGNHNLLKTIYSIASGASYIHNSYPDTENIKTFDNHSSLVLELIAKEALYVPKRNELLSISPVHLSIYNPQERYLNEGENNKWTTFYNREFEEKNPAVFSHMNGSWLGASLTPWDFSTYASGVIDRRQNCIPTYPNGMVLITPVQEGILAKSNQPRGKLEDHLHPFYKGKLIEYITDGVDYISKDGKKRYKADEYYKKIKSDIEKSSKLLPVNIKGSNVGWVVAQVSPTHLRLTLVDGGYLNPNDKNVTVEFNNIVPKKITDILSKREFKVTNNRFNLTLPCGMFLFLDIELTEKF